MIACLTKTYTFSMEGRRLTTHRGGESIKLNMAEQWEGEHGYAPKDHNHEWIEAELNRLRTSISSIETHTTRFILKAMPVGTIMWFKRDDSTLGDWLRENGWAIYDDLVGRYPLGCYEGNLINEDGAISGAGTIVEAGLPNISGMAGTVVTDSSKPSSNGALSLTDVGDNTIKTSDWTKRKGRLTFDASAGTVASVSEDGTVTYMSESESPYGKSTTVTPPSVMLVPYIKISGTSVPLL